MSDDFLFSERSRINRNLVELANELIGTSIGRLPSDDEVEGFGQGRLLFCGRRELAVRVKFHLITSLDRHNVLPTPHAVWLLRKARGAHLRTGVRRIAM